MKCIVLVPCDEAPVAHSPDRRAHRSPGEEKAVDAGIGGYLAFEADDLKSAIKLAARIRAVRMAGTVEARPVLEQD
jgi:hypothetical protein